VPAIQPLSSKAALPRRGEAFYDNKLITGRYFLERLLPDGAAHLEKVKAGAETLMALPAEAF